MSIIWINYKKAYDSVPHEWITKVLDLYKIDKTIKDFITAMITKWKTRINLPSEDGTILTDLISFGRGIFQCNSLSPLLFCLVLIPLTNLLKRRNVGYTIEQKKISNLLYMDDLKIY